MAVRLNKTDFSIGVSGFYVVRSFRFVWHMTAVQNIRIRIEH